MNTTHRLFLQVLSQAIGDHKGDMILRHQFISAYEQACLWVESNGYGVCTDDGAVLHADPWDVLIDSADLEPQAPTAPASAKGEGTDWEQRAKAAEEALWCIHIHGYAPEYHFAMTCACATRTRAMLDRIAQVAAQAPTAPASAKGEEKP